MNFEFSNVSLHIRPIADNDLPILFKIFASTREIEMMRIADLWTDDQKDGFLSQQFQAQRTYYQREYKDTNFWILLLDNEVIGRLYINLASVKIHIVDISILPEYRNMGYGKMILQDIILHARQVDKKVQIYVERNNPAMNLYNRLNFKIISDTNEIYYLMEC
jgi:ribosomal protein S18 acetylase RimI-like enzyme